jgi:hypothetical protein
VRVEFELGRFMCVDKNASSARDVHAQTFTRLRSESELRQPGRALRRPRVVASQLPRPTRVAGGRQVGWMTMSSWRRHEARQSSRRCHRPPCLRHRRGTQPRLLLAMLDAAVVVAVAPAAAAAVVVVAASAVAWHRRQTHRSQRQSMP